MCVCIAMHECTDILGYLYHLVQGRGLIGTAVCKMDGKGKIWVELKDA